MNENKLVEKTKIVMKKQQELTEVIDELKSEVKEVFYVNKRLNEENALLLAKVAKYEKHGVEAIPVKEEIVEPAVQVEEGVKPEKAEQVISRPVVVPPVNKKTNALLEFFLGKNVIAKIATILIFLGVISFGQIAYEGLDEVGRVLLIMFGGFVAIGIAIFTEKKNLTVFSNVFYGLGVFIVYYSLVLGYFSFDLFSESALSYTLITLSALVFVFFRNKRYDFLDVVLYLFYTVVVVTLATYVDEIQNVSLYFETILISSMFGYISYVYFRNYYRDNDVIKTILSSIFTLGLFIYLMTFFVMGFQASTIYHGANFNILIIAMLSVYLVYLINIDPVINLRSILLHHVLTSFYVVLLMLGVSLGLMTFLYNAFGFENMGLLFLMIAGLLIPLYVYLYNKKLKGEENLAKIYFIFIAFNLLLFSFMIGPLNDFQVAEFGVLNLILAIEIIILFVVSKYTNDKQHQQMWIVFAAIMILRNIFYYLVDGDFLFTSSLTIFSSVGLGIILVALQETFKRLKINDNQTDNVLAHSTNVVFLIPLFITFINDLVSNELAYAFTIVVLVLVAYRWLTEVKIFDIKYKGKLIFGLNISIVLLTLFLNLFYFDHDFKLFEDVLKFWILFSINVYVAFALRELFMGIRKSKNEVEIYFVLTYLIGVFIHSMFLHNYINFEFDKVILSSYFLIASAVGVLFGFRNSWSVTRKLGLFAIYFSLGKFFIYDMYNQSYTTFERMVTYFILGFILLGISLLYAYLEKTYGHEKEIY